MAKATLEVRRALSLRCALAAALIGPVLLPAFALGPLKRETDYLFLFRAVMAVAPFAGPGPCVPTTMLGAQGFQLASAKGGQFRVLDRGYDLHPGIWTTVGMAVARTSSCRRRGREELQESERRFHATFEQAAMGVAHVALERGFAG